MSADLNQCKSGGQWKWLINRLTQEGPAHYQSGHTLLLLPLVTWSSPFSSNLALTTAFSTMSAQNFLHSDEMQKRQRKQSEKREVRLYLAL